MNGLAYDGLKRETGPKLNMNVLLLESVPIILSIIRKGIDCKTMLLCDCMQGALKCDVYFLECRDHRPECCLHYSGEQDCLHFWTKFTAAGDEIGWDFVLDVRKKKTSFSAYCECLSDKYLSYNGQSASFMSRATFVLWFFSWACRMNIDFRKHIDPFCGHSPKFLAGDGTHVGVTLRNLHIIPIEKPSTNAAVRDCNLRRHDRTFLCSRVGIDNSTLRNARSHLLLLAKCALSEVTTQTVSEETLQITNQNLISCLPPNEAVFKVVDGFIEKVYVADVHQALAVVLKTLTTLDAPVSSVVPFRFLSQFDDVLTSQCNSQYFCCQEVYMYSPELAKLLHVALINGVCNDFINFCRYLISFVRALHSSDSVPSSPEVVPGTYNPESGVAYYFSPSGEMLRHLCSYKVTDDKSDGCTKLYPRVSHGGFSYAFFWFCPIHGHCYGFHVIDGAEGRKDPFASLVKYMPVAPREVFYDFCCSLAEYSLNREPGFFCNTRFWHDIFHGYTHKCSAAYNSSRIPSLSRLNTEICEQFNAYLQCIKYTASHLSQSHFVFFVQFFMFLWNEQKTTNCSKLTSAYFGGSGVKPD